ncbi:hypothetical protein C0J52_23079 [Blattella germanica]|nr:hypothetical protein C0J52_23079 [Blattella germanica]
MTCGTAYTSGEVMSEILMGKYNRPIEGGEQAVINPARSRKLATAESTVLAKGGNFVVMPTMIPVEDM